MVQEGDPMLRITNPGTKPSMHVLITWRWEDVVEVGGHYTYVFEAWKAASGLACSSCAQNTPRSRAVRRVQSSSSLSNVHIFSFLGVFLSSSVDSYLSLSNFSLSCLALLHECVWFYGDCVLEPRFADDTTVNNVILGSAALLALLKKVMDHTETFNLAHTRTEWWNTRTRT